jgi:hypothetical protein
MLYDLLVPARRGPRGDVKGLEIKEHAVLGIYVHNLQARARARARTHARANARTRAQTHARTHAQDVVVEDASKVSELMHQARAIDPAAFIPPQLCRRIYAAAFILCMCTGVPSYLYRRTLPWLQSSANHPIIARARAHARTTAGADEPLDCGDEHERALVALALAVHDEGQAEGGGALLHTSTHTHRDAHARIRTTRLTHTRARARTHTRAHTQTGRAVAVRKHQPCRSRRL